MSSNTSVPEWPSLYNLAVELLPRQHPELRGRYITQANDAFRFTFYWMLVFHAPLFVFCGAFAFLNIVYPPKRHHRDPELAHVHDHHQPPATPHLPSAGQEIPLSPLSARRRRSLDPLLSLGDGAVQQAAAGERAESQAVVFPPRKVRRTRAAYALIVLLTFFVTAVAAALVKSLAIGYILAGVYAAADYRMSTWVPFVWALMMSASSALGVFSSVIDRI